MVKDLHRLLIIAWLIIGILSISDNAVTKTHAQTTTTTGNPKEQCRDDIKAEDGYKFRQIKIKSRYFPSSISLTKADYSPQIVTDTLDSIHSKLRLRDNPFIDEEVAGFTYLNSCVVVVKENECQASLGQANKKCIDLTIRDTSLRISPSELWRTTLNKPRSAESTYFSNVPEPLIILNPKFGTVYDRKLGIAAEGEVSTNLLNLKKDGSKDGTTQLNFSGNGQKSVYKPFYVVNTDLTLKHRFSEPIEEIDVSLKFNSFRQPLGLGNYTKHSVNIGGDLKIHPDLGPFTYFSLGGDYRWSNNNYRNNLGLNQTIKTQENGFEARVIADGHIGNGVTRFGVWLDGGRPKKFSGSYKRLAGLFGYQKEFVVKPNQSIGVEAILGAGYSWGKPPVYVQFYGGNETKDFLYEDDDSPVIQNLPSGPLFRSFGKNQYVPKTTMSLVNGGTSYSHFNLNVTLPISKWSRPLLPDITVTSLARDSHGNPVFDPTTGDPLTEEIPLRDKVSGLDSVIINNLKRKFIETGLSEKDAEVKAKKELKDVTYLLSFITKQANVFSVKPLVMFDVARIDSSNKFDTRTRTGIGGGFQLTIVTAKFEAGYISTINKSQGDSRGNLVFRLYFQNLF